MFNTIIKIIIRQSFKIESKPGVVAHACNPSIWEAETGGSGFAASLSYLVRLLQFSETQFQIKNKNGLEL